MTPDNDRFRFAVYAALVLLTVVLAWALTGASGPIEAFI
jgi:hypothetical protein